jgi:hypothetical protein
MKAAIEAMRNKEMGSCKATRLLNLPQTALQRYVNDRKKSSSETIKTKLGRKQVLPCEAEKDLTDYCILMERKLLAWQWLKSTCCKKRYYKPIMQEK